MATIQYFPGNALFAAPTSTFDITGVVAKRVGGLLNYYSFDTDGTMFVLHTRAIIGPDGVAVPTITGWDHFDGATVLQSGTSDLALQPFLDNMNSRNPSSTRAMAYIMGGNDTLTGSNKRDVMVAGNGDDVMKGGGGADRMNGGNGADHLTGGIGADVLTGGAGADHFIFDTLADGGDRITDFQSGIDHFDLSATAFGLSTLVEGGNFISGGAAPVQSGATLLYDSTSGVLSYDADGNGASAAVTLATFSNHAALTLADFLLV